MEYYTVTHGDCNNNWERKHTHTHTHCTYKVANVVLEFGDI